MAMALPQRSDAFAPLLGAALARMSIGFGLRLGMRRAMGVGVRVSASGLSVSASRVLGSGAARATQAANQTMRRNRFINFSQAEIGVTTHLPLARFFYPVIRDDNANCCVPFCAVDGLSPPVMLEAPSLVFLSRALDDAWFDTIQPENRQKLAVPLRAFDADNTVVTRPVWKSVSFFSEAGHCEITVRSERRISTPDEMLFAGSVAFFDRAGRMQFAREVEPLSLLTSAV